VNTETNLRVSQITENLAAEILGFQARFYPLASVINRLTYLIRSTNHEIPQYAIFAGFLLLRTPWAQISSTAPYSRKFTLLLSCYFFILLVLFGMGDTVHVQRRYVFPLHLLEPDFQFFEVFF